jgi:hypothetical protein
VDIFDLQGGVMRIFYWIFLCLPLALTLSGCLSDSDETTSQQSSAVSSSTTQSSNANSSENLSSTEDDIHCQWNDTSYTLYQYFSDPYANSCYCGEDGEINCSPTYLTQSCLSDGDCDAGRECTLPPQSDTAYCSYRTEGDCEHQGRFYTLMETWEEYCQECTCTQNGVVCSQSLCSSISCQSDADCGEQAHCYYWGSKEKDDSQKTTRKGISYEEHMELVDAVAGTCQLNNRTLCHSQEGEELAVGDSLSESNSCQQCVCGENGELECGFDSRCEVFTEFCDETFGCGEGQRCEERYAECEEPCSPGRYNVCVYETIPECYSDSDCSSGTCDYIIPPCLPDAECPSGQWMCG